MKQIFYLLPAAIILCCFISCTKNTAEMKPVENKIDTAASYKIIITGTWRSPKHTIPSGEHFTPFIGLVHGKESGLFKIGLLATTGIEKVAEDGYGVILQNEMESYITAGKALNRFQLTLPTITSVDSAIINLSSQQSLISFASMIAPSPDWFVGIESYNLVQNGKWVTDTTINALGYDAGTEDGDVFGYANPATMPQQPVSYLTPANASVIANGNTTIAPFATVRFIRQK